MKILRLMPPGLLIATCLLSACGGGDSTAGGSSNDAPGAPAAAPAPAAPSPAEAPAPAPVLAPASPPVPIGATPSMNIATWGDSLTSGDGGIPYPTTLQTLLPGRVIYNGGGGGQGSSQIAARQGSYPLLVTLSDKGVPTSGSVDLQSWNVDALQPTAPWPLWGSLAGVEGRLDHSPVGAIAAFFPYQYPTKPVTVPAGTRFYVDNQGKNAWVNVLWLGRNSYSNPTRTLHRDVDPECRVRAADHGGLQSDRVDQQLSGEDLS